MLYVFAKDGGDPIQTGMLTVNVTIGDYNDHDPLFVKETYNVTVQENVKVGHLVVKVSATDEDAGDNGEITYQYSPRQMGEGPNFFNLDDNTGEIKVKKRLEYLPASSSYEMVVIARDHGDPQRNSQAKVIINILDTNNNAPSIKVRILSGTTHALVSENATIGANIVHIEASDGDSGSNGEVDCSIQSDHFEIKPMQINQYTVTILKRLDREKEAQYNITIFCQDRGTPSLSSSSEFVVDILDENDNTPEFSMKKFIAYIYENNENGDNIIQVTATDRDVGNNAKIRYSLGSDAGDRVYIETNTGIIHAQKIFDRENETSIEFTVIATDSSPPFHSANARVLLEIKDENDEYPAFAVTRFELTVDENLSDNVWVGQLLASDNDEGVNQKISYHLDPQNESPPPFSVLENGTVLTLQGFDRENISSYTFSVIAVDGGINALTSTAEVRVTISDENDNTPVILFPDNMNMNSTVYVAHSTEPNSVIGRIVAEDADYGKNSKISYLFVDGNSNNIFYLDVDSGEIFLNRELELKDIKSYNLVVSIHDNGDQQMTTRASLEISVFLSNVTTQAPVYDDTEAKNILIVVSISCVTFVLSALMIILICIVKRMDDRKKPYSSKAVEELHVMETLSGDSIKSVSSSSSHDMIVLSDNKLVKKSKKEVSFSLEGEEQLSTYPDVLDGKAMKTFQPYPVVHNKESFPLSPMQEPVENERQQREIHRMASLRLQQALLQSQSKTWTGQEEDKQYLQFVKNLDDTHSQSSGETTTSDSGRGGSDEDIHNSNVHDSDEVQSRSSTSTRSACISNDSGVSPTSVTKQPDFIGYHAGVHHPNTFLSSFRRDNNIRNSSSVPTKKFPLKSSVPSYNRTDRDSFPKSKRGMPLFDKNTERCSQRTSNNINLMNSFDDTYSESATGTRDDDTDSTTTSGSYTIDPEDLCTEINDLFFRPDASTIV
ncbi:hypothetical protein ScPMuIL_010464 [Solemya velum]